MKKGSRKTATYLNTTYEDNCWIRIDKVRIPLKEKLRFGYSSDTLCCYQTPPYGYSQYNSVKNFKTQEIISKKSG